MVLIIVYKAHMIVCSCNRITEQEIRDMARIGAATTEAAYAALGCEAQCGCCLEYAQELIDEERAPRPKLRLVSSGTTPRAA